VRVNWQRTLTSSEAPALSQAVKGNPHPNLLPQGEGTSGDAITEEVETWKGDGMEDISRRGTRSSDRYVRHPNGIWNLDVGFVTRSSASLRSGLYSAVPSALSRPDTYFRVQSAVTFFTRSAQESLISMKWRVLPFRWK
jgi:hypothetical protein